MTRTVYRIRDTADGLIAEHVRVDWPDGTKRLYWQTPGCDPRDGLMGLSTPDLPLYGSEILGALIVGQTVVVTEGERAAEALWSLGLPALGTVTGASSTPGGDALSVLLPFDVVTWEDYDDPGALHMARTGQQIIRLGGHARRLRWGRDKGDDAADFVDRGGTRDTLDLLIQAASPWVIEAIDERFGALRVLRPSYDRHDDDGRVGQARSHLAEVVQQRLGPPARHMGRSLFWCCPFHDDRSPSFKVDVREPFFRCFGCGAKGDVFEFLRISEGVEFKDALRELAPPRLLGAAIPW